MYKPLAGQLRILLCDSCKGKDNSLLPRVFPDLRIGSLTSIDWSEHQNGLIALYQPPNGNARIARMPYEITRYRNGLVISDLLCDNNRVLDISSWMDQHITFHPTPLTAREIVRHVADKGGGSHVDKDSSPQLRYMNKLTPTGQTFGELFVLALGRFAQAIGERLFDYTGPKVPLELQNDAHEKFSSLLVAYVEYADALTKHSCGRS